MDVLTFFLLGLPAIPNLFGIWHAWHRVFPTRQERLWWLGACVFIPVFGGLAYVLFGMRRGAKE